MNVEIVDVSGCKKNLVAEIPSLEVDQEIEKLAREYARNAKVPGFRPGKVPLNIIKRRYGNELRTDATREIVQRCWKDAIKEHDLHPLAEPSVQDIKADPGNPLQFRMEFEILPSLEIKDYKEVPVTIPANQVEDSDVDKTLDHLREDHAQYIPCEGGAAKDGNLVVVTVDGQFEDNPKPIHEEGATLIIGDPHSNAEFSENLRGAAVGDVKSFDVSYPAEYHRKRFAGKKVHYTLKVEEIKEKQLPDLNDEFAKDLGAESLEDLRTKVRDQLVTKGTAVAEKKAREDVLDEVVKRHSFDVPDCLVQGELEHHARRIASNLARQGVDINKTSIDWKKVLDQERPHAEQSVRRSIVLDAIARQEGLEVSDEELDKELEKLAEGTGKTAAALKAQFEKDERIQEFRDTLRQDKALEFIFLNATITRG